MLSKLNRSTFFTLFALSLIHFLSSGFAFAQDENAVPVVKVPKNTIIENSSEHNRIGKKFDVMAQAIGFGPAHGVGSGLSVGYYLDRNSKIMLDVASYDAINICIFCTASRKSQLIGLHYQWFAGNSFYVRGGSNYVASQFYVRNQYLFSDKISTRQLEGNYTTAEVSIGSQWQWSNFTLACDWIALGTKIGSNVTLDSVSTNSPYSEYQFQARDRDDYFGAGSSASSVLRFSLGATF